MPGVLDLDVSAIKDPNEPAPKATYRLVVTGMEIKESDSGSVGVVRTCKILTPGEHQGKSFGNYINIQKKNGEENKYGTWEINQMLAMKKIKKGKLKDNIPQVVGLEFDAELDVEIPEPGSDQEQYGSKNVIKRILK